MSRPITIFTPTYNRAYILGELYESLVAQTCKNFKWLIIDDGSNDETRDLVESWMAQNKLDIEYIFQDNRGMVAAHNTAISNIDSELFVCIDSDDKMPPDGVDKILSTWNEVGDDELMGLVGLDAYETGDVIGEQLPEGVQRATFSELRYKYKVKGDKKYVLRTELAKSVLPYPYVKGEKFPAPSYIYLKLEALYKFYLLNHVLCIVKYLPDGNSMNKVSQYRVSPNAFALYRIAQIQHSYGVKDKFRNTVHYIAAKLLGERKGMFYEAPDKCMFLLALPFGVVLYWYISRTKRSAINLRLNKR